MNRNQWIAASTAMVVLLVTATAQAGWWPFGSDESATADENPVVELNWEDLIPDDFVQPTDPFGTMSQEEVDKLMDGSPESEAKLAKIDEAFNYAPVVDALDGKRVQLPAYVTPLEFDGQTRMSEFLLVPYMGACIHTPPPPANQVVHAESGTPIELESSWDPIVAVGILHAETVRSNLAESGYRLEVEEILPFKPSYPSDDSQGES